MKSSWRGTAFRAGSLAEAAMIDADTDPSVERGLNRMFSSRLDGCDVTLVAGIFDRDGNIGY